MLCYTKEKGGIHMKYVLIGAGSRGTIYSTWAANHGIEIAAIAELRPDRLKNLADAIGVPESGRYPSADAMFAAGKLGDAALICTQDQDHFGHAMQALDLGYDLLLEKPISPSPRECMAIEAKANALGKKVTVCHVLRYTNFFGTLKDIIDSGELGKVVAIKHSENIGNYHMAHSFVRGNWRRTDTSAPIILAKSCHDLDMLLWLTDSHCTKVAAFGSLSYFKESNAPANSTDRCSTCPVAENCRYNAWRCYQPTLGQWPTDVVCLEQNEKSLMEALENGPYGRCVYRCDNDVCDHMSMIMEFKNGVTATFSLTAQTSACHRHIHIMCEDGEIEADDGTKQIILRKHVSSPADTFAERIINIRTNGSGHGGGDAGIMEAFTESLRNPAAESRSSITKSVESHLMAGAIELSRLTGKMVDMEEYRKSLA